MTNMQERLNAAVDTTEADSTLFHTIVHGDDQTVVQTENGGVPSVAKAINDLCSSISSESNNIVKIASEAAISAEKSAILCKETETKVLENAKIAHNAKIWAEGSDEQVAACGGTHSARGWVELARKTTIGCYPTEVSGTASASQQELFLNGAILGVSGQILSVIVENTCLLPQNYTLSEDGKNVRLMSSLSVGERWSVKYLQDIQTLSTLVGAIVYEDMEVA